MGLNIETLQNIPVSGSTLLGPNETLTSYTAKINRRLAVLANLGQRFGQEGQGFYIERKTFSDIIDISTVEEAREEGPVRLCVTLYIPENKESDINTLRQELDIQVQYLKEGSWITYTSNVTKELYKPNYAIFFLNVFQAYSNFIEDLWNNKKSEYFSKLVSETDGVLVEQEKLPSFKVAFYCDSAFDIIYDSSTNLPVCLAQPYCITSDLFYTEDFNPLFTAKFTAALNVDDILIDAESKEEVGKFFVVEYGLGIKDTGEIIFNGLGSDIVLDGADGDNAQVYILKGVVTETLDSNKVIVSSVTTAFIHGPQGTKDAKEYPLIQKYTSSAGKIAYYIEPDKDYYAGQSLYYTEGAIAFSFITVQASTLTGRIEEHCVATVLMYTSHGWVPLGKDENADTIFTFFDLIDSQTIERNIRQSLACYFAGSETDPETGHLFKHDKVIFRDSKLFFSKDIQHDAELYRMPGNFVIETFKPEVGYLNNFSAGVLNIKYDTASIPEDLKERCSLTFEDMILENLETLKRNRPRLFYNQEQYSNQKVSFELPTVSLNNSSLFMPSIVDELRIYNIYDPGFPKAGWTEKGKFGIPETKITGTSLSFGELEYNIDDKGELQYTPVATARLSEQWNTSVPSQRYTRRVFNFEVLKNDTRYPLELDVDNVFYQRLNTLVIIDDVSLNKDSKVHKTEYLSAPVKFTVDKHHLTFEKESSDKHPDEHLSKDYTSTSDLSASRLKFTDQSKKYAEYFTSLELDSQGITVNRDFSMKMVNFGEVVNTFITIEKRKFVIWSDNNHQNYQEDNESVEEDPSVGYWRYPLTSLFVTNEVTYNKDNTIDSLRNQCIEIAPNYQGAGRDEVYQVNLWEAIKRGYIQESDIVFDQSRLSYFYYPCINNVPVSHKSTMWLEWKI